MTDLADAAFTAHRAGLSVVPPREDGSKRPLGEWKRYQSERATPERIEKWYSGDRTGLGVVCGQVSGGLECLEFEATAVEEGLGHQYRDLVEAAGYGEVLDRVKAGYLERTPTGGLHLLYRCEQVAGNQKLAGEKIDGEIRVLIETRGEGGYVIVAPSNGRVHETGLAYTLISGSLDTIETITVEERAQLLAVARLLDRMPEQPRMGVPDTVDDDRPGDRYNAEAGADERALDHLVAAGWVVVHRKGEVSFLRRPGKDKGISATFGYHPGLFYPFSTSTVFEAEKGYTPFGVYTVLEHGGDWSEAARTLYKEYEPEPPRAKNIRVADTVIKPRLEPDHGQSIPIEPEAFHGVAGEWVNLIAPHSEADKVAVLVDLLTAYGNAVGPSPYFMVEKTKHSARLFSVLVGNTARARKGTARGNSEWLLRQADEAWSVDRNRSGLSTGEGLLAALEPDKEGRLADARLFVIEPEFAKVLQVTTRQGNTLSVFLRMAWDSGDMATMVKVNPLRVKGAHISVVAHITAEELRRHLNVTEMASGFANRFNFHWVRRTNKIAVSTSPDLADIDQVVADLKHRLGMARKVSVMDRSSSGNEMWTEVYNTFDDDVTGLVGFLIARAEAQLLRLSMVYALLDGSPIIEPPHIAAAVAVWEHSARSIQRVFGDDRGDLIADQILAGLKTAGERGLSRTEIYSGLLQRHVRSERLDIAVDSLINAGLAERVEIPTEGRPRTVIRYAHKAYLAQKVPGLLEVETLFALNTLTAHREKVSNVEHAFGAWNSDRCRCGAMVSAYTPAGFPYCTSCGPPS